jgi:5-methylcytosine-specific restriction endonuclease McrA
MKMNQECGCCSKDQKLQLYQMAALVGYDVDHRVPLALGGHHCAKNLQPLSTIEHSKKTADDVRRIRDVRVRNRLLRQWPRPAAVGEFQFL